MAQDLSFRNYSTRDGLSSAQVYQAMQDINGDMLFSTDRGITKYDGTDFEVFSLADGLTNTTVFNFFPQEDGKVWCSTIDNSWFYFQNGSTHFVPCDQNELIKKYSNGGHVQDLWISKSGDMYFGFEEVPDYLKINSSRNNIVHPLQNPSVNYDTLKVLFIEKENGGMFKYYMNDHQQTFESEKDVKMIIKQPREKIGYKRSEYINGHYLFSTDKYLILKKDEQNIRELLFDSRIIGLGRYDQNHFWVGIYEGGIKIFDMEGNETHHWLKNNSVTNLCIDSHGGIWISTLSNGVYFAQNDKIKHYITEENSFIFSVSSGKNGAPLISTFGKHFLIEKDKPVTIIAQDKLSNQKIIYNKLKDIYQGQLETSDILNAATKGAKAAIIDFSENNDSSFLIASPFRFFTQTEIGFLEYEYPTRITAIEIADNGFLVGGYSGLSYVKKESLEIVKSTIPECNGRIKDIKLKGAYHYIATNENGLVRWNEKENRTLHITKAQGLASDLLNEVFAETESCLWVATNKGLDRITFNGDSYTIKHFGIEHGLPDNDVTDVYVFQDIIWIATRSGLCSITKTQFDEAYTSIGINLFWKSFKINGNTTELTPDLSLAYNENNLELDFHSAFYGGLSRVKYRYKIDERSSNWIELSGRKIPLTNLPSGKYQLLVQAKVDNSNWADNQLLLDFNIRPPFYQTWWFRMTLLIVFGFLIYLFFKLRVLIYNKPLVKEALRLIIRKLNPKLKTFTIQEQGATHRINSNDILFLNSEGNYLIIQLKDKKHTIRYKIGDYEDLVPDKLEYLRVHKSFVVRIDKITSKNADTIFIENFQIPIGKTYKTESKNLDEIVFERK